MNDKEKNIYNTYLAVTRSRQNKPFTLRKDFNNFTNTPEAAYVKKLALFFGRYPHISVQDFFTAPYEIHSDTGHLPLQHYLTRAAIKDYSVYTKQKEELSPDNLIDEIRKSFHHIGMFCFKNKINLEDYVYYMNGCTYAWMQHYREHYINVYSILELGDISNILKNVPDDESSLLVGDLKQNISKFKTRYFNSKVAKKFACECKEKIKKFLKPA